MTIRLNTKDFKSRLTDSTTIGEPTIMGTPFAVLTMFDFSGRPFYGEFNNSEFRLARNKIFPFQTGYIIKGKYSTTDSNGTTLKYEIKPIQFYYYWIRVMPVIFLIVLNIMFIKNLGDFTSSEIIVLNIFFLFGLVLMVTVDKFSKKRLEKRFQEEFGV